MQVEKESKSVGLEKDALLESSNMGSGKSRDYCQSGVNPATHFTGINLDQNWID